MGIGTGFNPAFVRFSLKFSKKVFETVNGETVRCFFDSFLFWLQDAEICRSFTGCLLAENIDVSHQRQGGKGLAHVHST